MAEEKQVLSSEKEAAEKALFNKSKAGTKFSNSEDSISKTKNAYDVDNEATWSGDAKYKQMMHSK